MCWEVYFFFTIFAVMRKEAYTSDTGGVTEFARHQYRKMEEELQPSPLTMDDAADFSVSGREPGRIVVAFTHSFEEGEGR